MIPLFIKSLKTKTHTPTIKEVKPEEVKSAQPKKGEDDGNMAHFSHLLSMLSDRKVGGDFGAHNVEAGHHVAFAAGSYKGAGKVTATGRDGLTVSDEAKREHRVHWREVTGHFAPEKSDAKESKPKKDKAKDAK